MLPVATARGPRRAGELLGQVLGHVARDTGSAAALEPVWRSVVGELVAGHARCHELRGETLAIRCDAAQWRDELVARQAELLAKLRAGLGNTGPSRLVFELDR